MQLEVIILSPEMPKTHLQQSQIAKFSRRRNHRTPVKRDSGGEAVFIPGIPPKKNLQYPPTAAKLFALNLFFDRDKELQIYHKNFPLLDRKLYSSLSNQECRFMPKMQQNTFGGRAPPRPSEAVYAVPQTRWGVYF